MYSEKVGPKYVYIIYMYITHAYIMYQNKHYIRVVYRYPENVTYLVFFNILRAFTIYKSFMKKELYFICFSGPIVIFVDNLLVELERFYFI